MTTNASESFNNVLKHGRDLPISALVMFTFKQLNKYFHTRRYHYDNTESALAPKVTTGISIICGEFAYPRKHVPVENGRHFIFPAVMQLQFNQSVKKAKVDWIATPPKLLSLFGFFLPTTLDLRSPEQLLDFEQSDPAMDFMKVFDQTVREIKREVNLKVLKVPEIEQKVLDATDNEPWGPHGSALAEIAQATKKFTECKMVMSVLWTRLGETGKDWRYVYKALTVIEYLVANGSEEAVDDIIEHTFRISSLSGFEYTEPNGKDMGINVRKKVENIVALLNNKDKIEEVRKKAATNRDKYVGVSSAGSTYKSGAAYGSSSYGTDYNGGRNSRREQDSFKDNFKDDQFGEDRYVKSTSAKSRRGSTSEKHGDSLMNTQQKRSGCLVFLVNAGALSGIHVREKKWHSCAFVVYNFHVCIYKIVD
ncbi:hypothetical protein QQ045_027325 [Rhodiola kirilowii]